MGHAMAVYLVTQQNLWGRNRKTAVSWRPASQNYRARPHLNPLYPRKRCTLECRPCQERKACAHDLLPQWTCAHLYGLSKLAHFLFQWASLGT